MGYFKDPRGIEYQPDHEWPIDVIITFRKNCRKFTGFGSDEVGTFKFREGTIDG